MKLSAPSPVGTHPSIIELPKVLAGEHAEMLKNWTLIVTESLHDGDRKAVISQLTSQRSATWYTGRRQKAAER